MGNPLRVLVVEDSEDDALLLVRELRRAGYAPRSLRVQTAEELQAALREHTWDVVVTDHNLPGFSSEAALTIVNDSGLDLPVIIVSGSIGEDIAVAAMKMGAHDYIMKDNLTRLVPAIERELREAELRRSHRLAEATIHHLAFHDHLTGLVNRHEFDRRLKEALRHAKEGEHAHVLLYLDLDQFKVINDTCGHQAGDQLLRQLAVVLREKVRSNDTLARLGGDEFGLLLESCPLEQAHQIAEGIREAVANFRFVWQDKTFSVGVSIGMTPITSDARSVDEILSAADVACYTAKDMGRNRVHVYLEDDSELLRRHDEMRWVSRIKQALEDDRFLLYRQSMQVLETNSQLHSHSEFLLRMVGDDGKIILPGAFIPAAERYGTMTLLDRWVVKSVIEHLSGLYRQTPDANKLGTFFVNLSGSSLNDAAFFSYIGEQLEVNRLPPELLCFEITETAAISNLHLAVDFIHGIRSLGCQFALDDFGSGLSSFSYLKAMPVDYLKIDGGFVRDITSDPMNYAIVQAVNEIGHVAGLRTIAEFVEDDAVLSTLQDIGVDLAQGYGIARPMAVVPVSLS